MPSAARSQVFGPAGMVVDSVGADFSLSVSWFMVSSVDTVMGTSDFI
jgi:hypothetical protein